MKRNREFWPILNLKILGVKRPGRWSGVACPRHADLIVHTCRIPSGGPKVFMNFYLYTLWFVSITGHLSIKELTRVFKNHILHESVMNRLLKGYRRVSNYPNKTAFVNLLGIVTGVCLLLMVWHMFKLLGKRGILPNDNGRNETSHGLRKMVESRVIK